MEDETPCTTCLTKTDIALAILGIAMGVAFLYMGIDLMLSGRMTNALITREEVSND